MARNFDQSVLFDLDLNLAVVEGRIGLIEEQIGALTTDVLRLEAATRAANERLADN